MEGEQYISQSSVVVVCGHYGVGKTNFSLNLAFDAQVRGCDVTLADLDVVNPFFRSSDFRKELEAKGMQIIAPVFAGTNVDGPSISGAVVPAVNLARQSSKSCDANREHGASASSEDHAAVKPKLLIIDAGGDDVGATALGRFADSVASGPYEMLYVVNHSRNLTQDASEAVTVLREIEEKSHLKVTGIVNNTHLMEYTDEEVIEQGRAFAEDVCAKAGLPLVCTTVPAALSEQVVCRQSAHIALIGDQQATYPVQIYVRTPW